MQASLETFEGEVAVERGADAAVVVDGELQSQTERVGLAANDTIGMGLGPDGFEPGLTRSLSDLEAADLRKSCIIRH